MSAPRKPLFKEVVGIRVVIVPRDLGPALISIESNSFWQMTRGIENEMVHAKATGLIFNSAHQTFGQTCAPCRLADPKALYLAGCRPIAAQSNASNRSRLVPCNKEQAKRAAQLIHPVGSYGAGVKASGKGPIEFFVIGCKTGKGVRSHGFDFKDFWRHDRASLLDKPGNARLALTLHLAVDETGESARGLLMRQGFPHAEKGQVIGLLGGSFDPAHEGHAHITREAIKRLHLDQVWWLVTPGNPLKARQPAPMVDRIAKAREVMQHPKVRITDLEERLGTRFTFQTVTRLQAMYPGVKFVWLMGADNLKQFHRWDRWQDILRAVPVAVLARPGAGVQARLSHSAQVFRQVRLARGEAIEGRRPPVWAFINLPLNDASSSAIRAQGAWASGRG